jgi:hypothetical protein
MKQREHILLYIKSNRKFIYRLLDFIKAPFTWIFFGYIKIK